MPGLSSIPEPTTAYRPQADAPSGHTMPLGMSGPSANRSGGMPIVQDQPQEQIDSVSFMLLLLIAGALLRAVLGFFGPIQGMDTTYFQTLAENGKEIVSGHALNAYPLLDVLAATASAVSIPAWLAVLLGSVLTLAAAPAAYLLGCALTGRRSAGLMGAAIIALHPAVLTASNTLSATAFALGLLTIGLGLLTFVPKQGQRFAIGGGIMLALAGLAAPLCWVVAAVAVPWVAWSSRERGIGQAVSCAVLVAVIGLGPVFGFRSSMFGTSKDALLPEFIASGASAQTMSPIESSLIMMTDPSLTELGEALRLPLGHAGKLTAFMHGSDEIEGKPDIVADILADAWFLMNAGLACLAMVSMSVMLIRRRIFDALLLACPLVAAGFCTVTPGETLRLPLMALIGIASLGLMSKRPVHVIDQTKLAEKAAKKAAKLALKEEKQRARQDRELSKYKGDIYAFDKPSRAEKKMLKQMQREREQQELALPTGIITERVTSTTSAPARPI